MPLAMVAVMAIGRESPLLGQPAAERFPFGALALSQSSPRRSVSERSGAMDGRVRVPTSVRGPSPMDRGTAPVCLQRSSLPLFVGFESGSLVSLTLLQVLFPVGVSVFSLGGPRYRQKADHPPGEQRD
jgi:hypothetical protein